MKESGNGKRNLWDFPREIRKIPMQKTFMRRRCRIFCKEGVDLPVKSFTINTMLICLPDLDDISIATICGIISGGHDKGSLPILEEANKESMHDSNTDILSSRQQPRTIRMLKSYLNNNYDSLNIMCFEESSNEDFTPHRARFRLPSNIRENIVSALIFNLTCDLEDASDSKF